MRQAPRIGTNFQIPTDTYDTYEWYKKDLLDHIQGLMIWRVVEEKRQIENYEIGFYNLLLPRFKGRESNGINSLKRRL